MLKLSAYLSMVMYSSAAASYFAYFYIECSKFHTEVYHNPQKKEEKNI